MGYWAKEVHPRNKWVIDYDALPGTPRKMIKESGTESESRCISIYVLSERAKGRRRILKNTCSKMSSGKTGTAQLGRHKDYIRKVIFLDANA